MKGLSALLLAAVVILSCGLSLADGQDPIVGVWYACMPASSGYSISLMFFQEDGTVLESVVYVSSAAPTASGPSRYGSWQRSGDQYLVGHITLWGSTDQYTAYLCNGRLYLETAAALYYAYSKMENGVPFSVIPAWEIEEFVQSFSN